MSIFEERERLEKQFELQRGAAYFLDRFEDADMSRARLLLRQQQAIPLHERLEKVQEKRRKKRGLAKQKPRARNLKGEAASIKQQQKIFERGQRRRPGEERIQIIGEAYVDPLGRVAQDPEIEREKLATAVQLQAMRNQAVADRGFADRLIADETAQAQRDVAREQRGGALDVAQIQRGGVEAVADIQGRQAVALADRQAERERVEYNTRLAHQRDRLVGERAAQRAELEQLQARIAQENRAQDAERRQALELTEREFAERAKEREVELRHRGMAQETDVLRIREDAQTTRARDVMGHERHIEELRQRAQRDEKQDAMLQELAAQNRHLTQVIEGLPDPIPEVGGSGWTDADRRFFTQSFDRASHEVDRRIGERQQHVLQQIDEHFDRVGATPQHREQVGRGLPDVIPLGDKARPTEPRNVGGGQMAQEEEESGLGLEEVSPQTRWGGTAEEAERLLRGSEPAPEPAPVAPPGRPSTPPPEIPEQSPGVTRGTPYLVAPESPELAQQFYHTPEGGESPSPPTVAPPGSVSPRSPRPPVIHEREETGTPAQELEQLLAAPSPLAREPEAEPPTFLERVQQGAQRVQEGYQELVRPETPAEALQRVEREGQERLAQEPRQPVVPGEQTGGGLQTPEGVPIRGLGQEIEQPQEVEQGGLGGGYAPVGGEQHQPSTQERQPGGIEDVTEEQAPAPATQQVEEEDLFEETEVPGTAPMGDVYESARLWENMETQTYLGTLATERGRPAGGARGARFKLVNATERAVKKIAPGEEVMIFGAEEAKTSPSGSVEQEGKLRYNVSGRSAVVRTSVNEIDRLVKEGKLLFKRV